MGFLWACPASTRFSIASARHPISASFRVKTCASLPTNCARKRSTSTAFGKSQAYLHRKAPKALPDDATLAHKVESIIFRDPAVPKGQINLNAEDGVVTLRGEVPAPAMIDALVARTREVGGVRRVECLLHLPGEPAPAHQ